MAGAVALPECTCLPTAEGPAGYAGPGPSFPHIALFACFLLSDTRPARPRKAVIVKNYDEGTSSRPYGHALVCGLATYPRKVTKKMPKKKQDKHSRVKTFIKTVNYNHLMPTRYSLDVDLKATVTPDALENATKKTAARKEAKKVLEERFKTGKSRWFFTRLAF